MVTKPFWKSWTLWANIGFILVDSVNQLTGLVEIPPYILVIVVVLGNVLLRLKTDSKVTLKR